MNCVHIFSFLWRIHAHAPALCSLALHCMCSVHCVVEHRKRDFGPGLRQIFFELPFRL